MKKIVFALAVALCSVACVDPATAVEYAHRAHPECSDFHNRNHSYAEGGGDYSLTEVSMKCGDLQKSIVVKCRFGYGILSDTVCYENN